MLLPHFIYSPERLKHHPRRSHGCPKVISFEIHRILLVRRILTINPSIVARFFPFLCDKLAEQNQSPEDRLEVFKTLQAIYRRHWTRELGAVLPELWQGIRAAVNDKFSL